MTRVGPASRSKPLYLMAHDKEIELWDADKNQKLAWLPELNPAPHRRVRLKEESRNAIAVSDGGDMMVTLSSVEGMGRVITWWPKDSWNQQ